MLRRRKTARTTDSNSTNVGKPRDQSLTVLAPSKGVGQRCILRVLLFVGQALHLPPDRREPAVNRKRA